MKALLLMLFFFASFPYLKAGDKDVFRTYYFFNSTCYYTRTENKAAILTLYKDSSFTFETYINLYSETQIYSGFRFSGNWRMNCDSCFELKYNTESAKGKSPDFGLTFLPYHCVAESENLLTDSKNFSRMFSKLGMNVALGEKWRYEQFSKAEKQPAKLTDKNFSLNRSYIEYNGRAE